MTVKSFGIKLSHLLPSQNNFLQAFPSVPMPKAGGVKAASAGSGSLLGLWLRLLVNLSFAEDGQQSILRVAGALELLADLAQHRRHALLTLHNLCFCPANKPHVIANGMKGKTGEVKGAPCNFMTIGYDLWSSCSHSTKFWCTLFYFASVKKKKQTE